MNVAENLLGKYLIRQINQEKFACKIIETEAYEGPNDKASHAWRGKTLRNKPMFEKPGTIYVYFIYGVHWMFNIVCGKSGYPAAVLIRGVENCVGPARLTKKLGIDKNLNGKMLGKKSGLWISVSAKGYGETKEKIWKIIKTPRVGVDYAGPIWSKKLYRFALK